jgi:hypothetical protein
LTLLDKRASRFRNVMARCMFQDNRAPFGEHSGLTYPGEQTFIVIKVVGGIGEYHLEAPIQLSQFLWQGVSEHLGIAAHTAMRQVFSNTGLGLGVIVDKHGRSRAATQGLDAVGPTPCKKVEERAAMELRTDYIEERFPNTVKCRSNAFSGWCIKTQSSGGPSYYSHKPHSAQAGRASARNCELYLVALLHFAHIVLTFSKQI